MNKDIKTRIPKKIPDKIDIGCGNNLRKGYTGLDVRDCGQEIVWDIKGGIPYPDNSIKAIASNHFLEHLTDAESQEFFKECWRVLKKGGIFEAILPHSDHPTAFWFDHYSYWNVSKVQSIERTSIGEWKVLENTIVEGQLYFKLKVIK